MCTEASYSYTTADIGKGFEIGSAALVSLAMFGASCVQADITGGDILHPWVFTGLLFGVMMSNVVATAVLINPVSQVIGLSNAGAEVEAFTAYVEWFKARRMTMATSSIHCTCTCRGVHHDVSSCILRRASTGSGILGASTLSLCRTCRG